jgi:hypothetical protein
LIADLQFEGQQLGRNAEAQKVYANLHRVGADAASAEGLQIAELTRANLEHQRALDQVADAYQQVRDVAQDALGTFVDDVRQGKSATDALLDSLNRVADRLIDMALEGALNAIFPGAGTVAGGLFGGLFGGARAAGGPVSPGQAYLTGERGPELFVPRVPGNIVPNGRLATGGTSTLRIELGDGLVASILDRAAGQSIQITQSAVTPVAKTVKTMLDVQVGRRGSGEYR